MAITQISSSRIWLLPSHFSGSEQLSTFSQTLLSMQGHTGAFVITPSQTTEIHRRIVQQRTDDRAKAQYSEKRKEGLIRL
jgi:hypothetical protein